MQSIVYKNEFILPPVDEAEALRYAGARVGSEETRALLSKAVSLLSPLLSPAAAIAEVSLERKGDALLIEGVPVFSKALLCHAEGQAKAHLFCATVGIAVDRCIRRSASSSLALSHMLSAVATERVEALCDALCLSVGGKTVRLSPGYADIPLSFNKDILQLLDCQRRLGVTLTESLLMTPTKSVTAIVFKKISRKDASL